MRDCKLEVAQLIEGRRHREEAMVKCTRIGMIIVSQTKENKLTGKQWWLFEEEVDTHIIQSKIYNLRIARKIVSTIWSYEEFGATSERFDGEFKCEERNLKCEVVEDLNMTLKVFYEALVAISTIICKQHGRPVSMWCKW